MRSKMELLELRWRFSQGEGGYRIPASPERFSRRAEKKQRALLDFVERLSYYFPICTIPDDHFRHGNISTKWEPISFL